MVQLRTDHNSPSLLFLLVTLLFSISTGYAEPQANTPPPFGTSESAQTWPQQADSLKEQLSKEIDAAQDALTDSVEQLQNQLSVDQLINNPKSRYPLEPQSFSKQQRYSFNEDIRPILNNKCIACHACYDAPCQLKMESGSALQRGASKAPVYDGGRLSEIAPSRLDVDAQTVEGWRNRGFFPAIKGYPNEEGKLSASLMQKMLELGRKQPFPPNRPLPKELELGLSRKNSCPAPDEFAEYAKDNPHGGMPLAIAGLSDREYKTLSTWLKEGAKTAPSPLLISPQEQSLINQWESWLNRKEKRAQLVSRYLFEHLFLAHLYFEQNSPDQPPTFFKLIRSLSPPGQPPVPVKTVRPNDAISGPFFYRLQPITGTIVYKTHIIYPFGKKRIAEYSELFFGSDWKVKQLPGYSEKEKNNPFTTFSPLPAKARYQFLLNDALFFVRNFIRGPVCRGQIATDVIRDQFWVMFEAPRYERYINSDKYRRHVDPLLAVPGLNSKLSDFGSEWLSHQGEYNRYIERRQQEYNSHFQAGAQLSHIWGGKTANADAFQTIFRHHDSASVVQGLHGAPPLTSWLLDYPLLERTIYELVVGFNVFGNVSHQAQTRLYFDLIRNEGETNLLRLLPADTRTAVYDDWYRGSGQIATMISYPELNITAPSAIRFQSDKPYIELLEQLMKRHPEQTKSSDPINRCAENCLKKSVTNFKEQINKSLQKLASRPAKDLPAIGWLPEITFLRINLPDGRYLAYSLLRNRIHSNVAFMYGESLRYQEEKDSLTIMPTLIGSYPNLIFQVDLSELNLFRKTLSSVNSDEAFEKVIEQWGARRMAPNFWELFHSFDRYMAQHKPLEAGIYDLNRYGHY
ncbi:MAG: fatty acid cis/trans isomerase [Pseudomonadales bacterium]|nr:fatty acid cis/trans isomerase [Pseudomonadales bacterium]